MPNATATGPALSLVVIRSSDIGRLERFYAALGLTFVRHRHGKGPEHLSATLDGTVFEIYPALRPEDNTTGTRLGFSVPSLTDTLNSLRTLDALVLTEPSETDFGRRAVVKDFEGHKIELYESVR